MNSNANTDFSTYEFHQLAWEALAKDIAKLKPTIKKYSNTENTPSSKVGKLTIIGSGIETLGFSFGDEEIIKSADKILYCVADPATVVWLRKLRPDALDLYVLYGEDKSRYTTYMQMTEAQLYWVRQGLNVVVIFYGHPGIFVLSTHRAIKLARREGHLAIMKAGVSALDTLCADLGVDPSHPGLQTHEATDCLIRRRNIDTSLHVILWQVGLIGELGFRRHGYLNNGFSYFVNWLIKIYGPDYQVTHYIGSRYPTIAPLINIHTLIELYDPDIQDTITGISTFYIPPRDVIETDRQTAIELGLLKEGQNLVTPVSPLREIGLYGKREMAAFDAFSKFSIPKSYRWQSDTPASDFLIALRFDPSLQNIYLQQPQLALDDPRFSNLSDKERQLLASRDSGAIQIAAKGGYIRSYSNEEMICSLLTSKKKCLALCQEIKGKTPPLARLAAREWLKTQGYNYDWSRIHISIDYVYRTTLIPWTGVYISANENVVITLLANHRNPKKSILYINHLRILNFQFKGGVIRWSQQTDVPLNGYLTLDLPPSGNRRMIGKTWQNGEKNGDIDVFIAESADPQSRLIFGRTSASPSTLLGDYLLRSNGRFSRVATSMTLTTDMLLIDGVSVANFNLSHNFLSWTGGVKDYFYGSVNFIRDPIAGSIEVYGSCINQGVKSELRCYGARQLNYSEPPPIYDGPSLTDNTEQCLLEIANSARKSGGVMLWHKWEKAHFTSMTVGKLLASIV